MRRVYLVVFLIGGVLAGCSGGDDSRARPKPGEPVVVATFDDGFLSRGLAVDDAGTVYTSGWDGKRFVIAAFPEKGKPTRYPIPCATDVGADKPLGFSLVAAPDGTLYWAAEDQHRVVRIDPGGGGDCYAGTGEAGYSGDGGPATEAQMDEPFALALDPQRGDLFLTDRKHDVVRKVDTAGVVTTFLERTALSGDIPEAGPAKLAFDGRRGVLYVQDHKGIFQVERRGTATLIPHSDDHEDYGALAGDPSRGGLVILRGGDGRCDVARMGTAGDVEVVVTFEVTRGNCGQSVAVDGRGDVWVLIGGSAAPDSDDLVVIRAAGG